MAKVTLLAIWEGFSARHFAPGQKPATWTAPLFRWGVPPLPPEGEPNPPPRLPNDPNNAIMGSPSPVSGNCRGNKTDCFLLGFYFFLCIGEGVLQACALLSEVYSLGAVLCGRCRRFHLPTRLPLFVRFHACRMAGSLSLTVGRVVAPPVVHRRLVALAASVVGRIAQLWVRKLLKALVNASLD